MPNKNDYDNKTDYVDENKPVWPTWAVGGRNLQGCELSKRTTADARLRCLSGGVVPIIDKF
jgi:hypothetical protein